MGKLFYLITIFCCIQIAMSQFRRRRLTVYRGARSVCGPVFYSACKCSFVREDHCRENSEVIQIKVPEDVTLSELPCDFNKYDIINNDQFIDIKEFAQIHGQTGEEGDVKDAFAFVDSDGDGKISREEFKYAPIIKQRCKGDDSPILWTEGDSKKNN